MEGIANSIFTKTNETERNRKCWNALHTAGVIVASWHLVRVFRGLCKMADGQSAALIHAVRPLGNVHLICYPPAKSVRA